MFSARWRQAVTEYHVVSPSIHSPPFFRRGVDATRKFTTLTSLGLR